jgi:hypothetical protein
VTTPARLARARDTAAASARDAPIGTREAAEILSSLLGRRLPERSVRRHAVLGHIPCLRLGTRIMYWESELRRWAAHRGPPDVDEG